MCVAISKIRVGLLRRERSFLMARLSLVFLAAQAAFRGRGGLPPALLNSSEPRGRVAALLCLWQGEAGAAGRGGAAPFKKGAAAKRRHLAFRGGIGGIFSLPLLFLFSLFSFQGAKRPRLKRISGFYWDQFHAEMGPIPRRNGTNSTPKWDQFHAN